MTSTLAAFLVVAASIGLPATASATATPIDLLTVSGVPDTGGPTGIGGPCYCDQPALFAPVMLLAPGTYDFGTVRTYWVKSDDTPDAGPNQGTFWLLFSPLETSGIWPQDFPPLATYAYPDSHWCPDGDDACNASFTDRYVDTRLVYTLPAGQDALQVGLVSDFRYTPPVPEPVTPALMLLGLACVAALARRQRRP